MDIENKTQNETETISEKLVQENLEEDFDIESIPI